MKTIILLILLTATPLFGQTYTNGFMTVCKGTSEYELVGKRITNNLIQGKTYEIDRTAIQVNTKESETSVLYFSNELICKLGSESEFMIGMFNQEILNLNDEPTILKSKSHMLNVSLMRGSAYIIFDGVEENSSVSIATPLAELQLSKGEYCVYINDRSVVVYVIKGKLTAYGEKKDSETVEESQALIAMTVLIRGLEESIVLSNKKIKADEIKISRVSLDLLQTEKEKYKFVVVRGKCYGLNID